MLQIAFVMILLLNIKIKANKEEEIINMHPLLMLFCRQSFSCGKEWPGKMPGMWKLMRNLN